MHVHLRTLRLTGFSIVVSFGQDNKCSWNINVALKHATEEQRKQLDVSCLSLHYRSFFRIAK